MKFWNFTLILFLTLSTETIAEELVSAPAGSIKLLEVTAQGVQTYTCMNKDRAFLWVFQAPEASLYDASEQLIGNHSKGPIWKLTDGSAVIGEKVAEATAPGPSSIPWTLLRAKSHEGTGQLSTANWIRRANTQGGLAPTSGCDQDHAGETTRIPYSALYQFYR